jgi:hypothetical protein
MRPDARRVAQARRPTELVVLSVQRTLRGRWEVLLPGRRRRMTCETLEEPCRVDYLAVAHAHPCDLILHDAYHRVVPPRASAPRRAGRRRRRSQSALVQATNQGGH